MAIIDGVSVSGTTYGLRDNDTSGGIAPTFSASTAYTAGQYVWYDSGSGAKLYRFTADHAAGAWTGTDATEVKLGNDVSALKSAFAVTTTDTNAVFEDGKWSITSGRVMPYTGTAKKRTVIPAHPGCAYEVTFCSYGTSSDVIIFSGQYNNPVGETIKGEATRTNITLRLIAPAGTAFLYVTHDTYVQSAVTPKVIELVNTAYADMQSAAADTLIEYLGAGVQKTGNALTPTAAYAAQITSSGNIAAITSDQTSTSIYPVESGKSYALSGNDVRLQSNNPIAAFGATLFDGTDTISTDLVLIYGDSTTAKNYDHIFTAPNNGYLYITSDNRYGKLSAYNAQYESSIIAGLDTRITAAENDIDNIEQDMLYAHDPYNYTLNDLFDNLESAYIDDFVYREAVVDSDHPYTVYGSESNAPTIVTGTGITRTGASGMGTLFYSKEITSFPYYCIFGRSSGAQMLIKLFSANNDPTDNVISISGPNGTVSSSNITYGHIHVNSIFCLFCVDTKGVTIFDDSGVRVFVPCVYTKGAPKNIAFGFGANEGRLFGYSSFVEFVRNPLSPLDFNRCVALNRGADSVATVKSAIRFTHTVWANGSASNTDYYIPESNPFMSLVTGLSNNPCIKCVADYATDSGYRTEIGITPIRNVSLHGKLGGLQRFKVSADYYMASDANAEGEYYTYIFQFHNAGFTPPQGWPTDPPPLTVRIAPNGHLAAFVTYVANGAVPASDNARTADEYDLGTFEMDKWMHLEAEARIGWSKALAPKLVIRINGQERLNIDTPFGFNIVKTGGYVNTHFGLYCPQWHDAVFANAHREILVTNIRWEGTQNIT